MYDSDNLRAVSAAGYSESLGEDQADRQQEQYDAWIKVRAGWAKQGIGSDDECEDGCGVKLTPSNISVSVHGWYCESCANRPIGYMGGDDYEDFGADLGIGVSDYEPFDY